MPFPNDFRNQWLKPDYSEDYIIILVKESQLLGTLLPSQPDFIPIEKAIREKYNLPEISPDGEPITEIYLGDEFISFDEFRNDINQLVHENLNFLPPDCCLFMSDYNDCN